MIRASRENGMHREDESKRRKHNSDVIQDEETMRRAERYHTGHRLKNHNKVKVNRDCTQNKSWGDIMDDEDREINERKKSLGDILDDEDIRRNRIHECRKPPFIKRTHSDKENTDAREVRTNEYRRAVARPLENNEQKLRTRQRQIDIGKGTEGYKRYIAEIKRKSRTTDHPRTPDKYQVCSTRSWQGTVRVWRRKLHFWDPPSAEESRPKFCDVSTDSFERFSDDESIEEKSDIMDYKLTSDGNNKANSDGDGCSYNSKSDDEVITEETLFWY